jgi:hypothetical protein
MQIISPDFARFFTLTLGTDHQLATMECDSSSLYVNIFTRTISWTNCGEWESLTRFFLDVYVALYSCHPLIHKFDAHNHTKYGSIYYKAVHANRWIR